MIPTLYRRDTAPDTPAPMFDPDALVDPGSIDELTGAVPTWRFGPEPIYRSVVRDLGSPWLDEPLPTGGEVVAGEVLPPTSAMDLAHLFDDPDDDRPVVDDEDDGEDEHPRDAVVIELPPTEPIDVVPAPTVALPRLALTGRGGRTRRAPRRAS